MSDKSPEELLRAKVVEAQVGGRVGALTAEKPAVETAKKPAVEAQSQALRPPAAPVLSGPPTPDELAPMLRDMRRQLRKGQAHLDESIMRTYGHGLLS